MINDLLNYELKIYQDKDYFKFSIDSVLLAEFVKINYRCKNIMDFQSKGITSEFEYNQVVYRELEKFWK